MCHIPKSFHLNLKSLDLSVGFKKNVTVFLRLSQKKMPILLKASAEVFGHSLLVKTLNSVHVKTQPCSCWDLKLCLSLSAQDSHRWSPRNCFGRKGSNRKAHGCMPVSWLPGSVPSKWLRMTQRFSTRWNKWNGAHVFLPTVTCLDHKSTGIDLYQSTEKKLFFEI